MRNKAAASQTAETTMDLILWRHAEAEDGLPDDRRKSLWDAKRKLTARGEKQAVKVARWLRKRLPDDARILSSPAARAMQTAQALDLPLEETKLIGTGADAEDILAAAGWPNAGGAVVVVGHQPMLGRVAALLLTGTQANWNIRKGAAWWFTCREKDGATETFLRAAIGPELA